MATTMQDVVSFILDAERSDLEMISKAMKSRWSLLTAEEDLRNRGALYMGDRVKIKNLSLKKAIGREGIIEELDEDYVKVKLDHILDTGKKMRSYLRVPYSCVEKLS